jgi:hypothetical protein
MINLSSQRVRLTESDRFSIEVLKQLDRESLPEVLFDVV